MNEPSSKNDHGIIVDRRQRGIAWVWIFPLLAAAATGWFIWKDYMSQGPQIEIIFDETPGIQAGKTPLTYRGVEAGMVQSVQLDHELGKVRVKVLLKASAEGLATKDTLFWVERPVLTLAELTGLESIIQGNSIRAANPGGEPYYEFTGLSSPPLIPLQPGSFTVRLKGENIPLMNRGTPVYHRGVKVGYIRKKSLADDGVPEIHLAIESAYRHLIRSTCKFWPVPATSFRMGQNGLRMELEGLDALVQGSIAFDDFEKNGPEAPNDSLLELAPNEFAARCGSRIATVGFDKARGIIPGETKVCYLGCPIGFVQEVKPDPHTGSVLVGVRLLPEFEKIADSASVFTLVQPNISLDGVSGLDTLVTGVYIEFEPGRNGASTEFFTGRSVTGEEWNRMQATQQGLPFQLSVDTADKLSKGAPVFYRGMVVGSITGRGMDQNQNPVVKGVVRSEFRNALDAEARFWRVPATSVKAGPGVLEFNLNGLQGLLEGGVAFDVFTNRNKLAEPGQTFSLFSDEVNARAVSAPIEIRFINGRGVAAGRTELRYLGVPVGIVESVATTQGRVAVTVRMNPGYDFLRAEDSVFTIIRPNISLQGVTGLETLVSGVYIECTPGSSRKYASNFTGRSTLDAEEILQSGLTIKLHTDYTPINVGASIFYRGIGVGKVTAKSLSSDGRQIDLTLIIERRYRNLVRANSKFWDSSGLKASFGVLQFRIQTESIMAPDGRISFATPENSSMGPAAKDGQSFELSHSPSPDWLKWNPSISIEN